MKINTVQKHFNDYIRNRDKNLGCISCGIKPKNPHAGHYLPVKWYSWLRFDKQNVNLQCPKCNRKNNFIGYRQGLIKKIGIEQVIDLERRGLEGKPKGFSWTEKRKQKILKSL